MTDVNISTIYDEQMDTAYAQILSEIQEKSNVPLDLDDEAINLRLNALTIERAIENTSVFEDLTNRAILLMLVEMERGELYKFLPQEMSSLEEWAMFKLRPLKSDDWISRYCNTVKRMLLPIDEAGFKDKETPVTAKTIIENASSLQSLKEIPYSYAELEGQRDLQEKLAVTLNSGQKHSFVKEEAVHLIEKKTRRVNGEDDSDDAIDRTPAVFVPRLQFTAFYRDDALIDISATINSADLIFLETILGKQASVALASGASA